MSPDPQSATSTPSAAMRLAHCWPSAAGPSIQFSTPVRNTDWGAVWIEVRTARDDLRARSHHRRTDGAARAPRRCSKLCFVDVASGLGAGLAEQGEAAMVAFAVGWLASLYGSGGEAG